MYPFLLNYWNGQSKTRPFSPQGVGRLPLEGVWKGAPAPTHRPWWSTAQPWGKPWEPQQNSSVGASPAPRERKRKATKCPSGACPRPGTAATAAQTRPTDGAEEKQSQDIGKLYFFSSLPLFPYPSFIFLFPFLFFSFLLLPLQKGEVFAKGPGGSGLGGKGSIFYGTFITRLDES